MKQKVLRQSKLRPFVAAAVVVFAVGFLISAMAARVLAAPPSQSPGEGERIFQQKCAGCHTVGKGDLLGPDLAGVTGRRDRAWLRRWIAEPDKVLAAGDPIATDLLKKYNNIPMPNLGLSESEGASLIAYLEAAGGGAPPGQAGAVAGVLPKGDAVVGKNLFTGTDRLQSGGPSCRACHSIAGIGALGGGALGPDLTGSYSRLGDAMITWPENFAPMKAIYSEKPLTEQEKAHLLAFFQSGSLGQRSTQAVWQLTGLAVAGVAVVLITASIIWRRRLSNVRRPMVTGQGRRGT